MNNKEELKEQILIQLKKDLGLAESLDILTFLEEFIYILNHSGETQDYATMGEEELLEYLIYNCILKDDRRAD